MRAIAGGGRKPEVPVEAIQCFMGLSSKTAVPTRFGTRVRFHGRRFFQGQGGGGVGWGGFGGNVSDGEGATGGSDRERATGSSRWGAADEAALARPPLTSAVWPGSYQAVAGGQGWGPLF